MTDLKAQKRMAADELDVGKSRLWFDPNAQGDIAEAITREDVRQLIQDGVITVKDAKGNSRGRARRRNEKQSYGHRKGHGTRKGKAGARQDSKDEWKNRVRAQRKKLRELRADGELEPSEYRDLYNKSKGGEFRSVRYMMNYIDEQYGDE